MLAKLDVEDFCEKVEIAGAGFLNFRLKAAALAEALRIRRARRHLFFQKTAQPRTVVIDFSSPNVAKPMHVGHIRSTILGDSLARALAFWGIRSSRTIILAIGARNSASCWWAGKPSWTGRVEADPIAEMERLYKSINAAERSPIPQCLERPARNW